MRLGHPEFVHTLIEHQDPQKQPHDTSNYEQFSGPEQTLEPDLRSTRTLKTSVLAVIETWLQWISNILDNTIFRTTEYGLESDRSRSRNLPEYVIEFAPLVYLFSGEEYWPCDMANHLNHTTPNLNYTPMQSESTNLRLDNLNDLNSWPHGWLYLTSDDDPEEKPDWIGGSKNIPVPPHTDDDNFTDNDGWVHHPGRTAIDDLQTTVENLQQWMADVQSHGQGTDLDEKAVSAKAYDESLALAQKYLDEEIKRFPIHGDQRSRVRGGRSEAPAVLIAVDKGDGIVDAFWFFFYSFNLGNTVLRVRFGNHVGDWEHTAIRFKNGKPQAVFFSEHNFGSAYEYDAVEKIGKRPVIYSATGTHAMYATPGLHPYILPLGFLHDQTDRGPLWDPALNSYMYTYDHRNDVLEASELTPDAPVGWFYYAGHWGDKMYLMSDKRQYQFAGQYHYVNGPLGPRFKDLGRETICAGPPTRKCEIKTSLVDSLRPRRWSDYSDEDAST